MSKTFISSIAVLLLAGVVTSRGDSRPASRTPARASAAEPISKQPIMPIPGSEMPVIDRFALHDPGPPEALVKYEDLTPAEQRLVDRGRDTSSWDNVHAAYNAAVTEQQPLIRAQVSASQIGVHELATLGVVR